MSKKSLQKAAVGLMTTVMVMLTSATAVQAQNFISPQDSPASVTAATQGQSDLKGLVRTILEYFLKFLGIVAVVMIIYGGFLYVTSAGKEESIGTAKKIIMYSVIGILVILASYAIVTTILGAATGSSA